MVIDRKTVIDGLEHCSDRTQKRCNPTCPYHERVFCETELAADALALLKEQEDLGTELTNAVELIHKKNERIEKLLKEHEVVRCKDCDNKECWGRAGDVVCGIDGTPHRPDWFCADGKRKE